MLANPGRYEAQPAMVMGEIDPARIVPDLPVVVASRKGQAQRFAPLPAAPPTGR